MFRCGSQLCAATLADDKISFKVRFLHGGMQYRHRSRLSGWGGRTAHCTVHQRGNRLNTVSGTLRQIAEHQRTSRGVCNGYIILLPLITQSSIIVVRGHRQSGASFVTYRRLSGNVVQIYLRSKHGHRYTLLFAHLTRVSTLGQCSLGCYRVSGGAYRIDCNGAVRSIADSLSVVGRGPCIVYRCIIAARYRGQGGGITTANADVINSGQCQRRLHHPH